MFFPHFKLYLSSVIFTSSGLELYNFKLLQIFLTFLSENRLLVSSIFYLGSKHNQFTMVLQICFPTVTIDLGGFPCLRWFRSYHFTYIGLERISDAESWNMMRPVISTQQYVYLLFKTRIWVIAAYILACNLYFSLPIKSSRMLANFSLLIVYINLC